jgi:hypothetical protein
LRLTYADNSVYTTFRTDSAGKLLINNTGLQTLIGITTPLSFSGAYLIARDSAQVQRWAAAPSFVLARANNIEATPTIVSIGDVIGQFAFQGYDGSVLQTTALIKATVDSVPALGSIPTRVSFFTGSSAGTLVESLSITPLGNVGIGTTAPVMALEVAKSAAYAQMGLFTYSSGTEYSTFTLRRSRTNTIGGLSTTASGEYLGYLIFAGVNTSNGSTNAAYIYAQQSGAAGAANIPTDIIFSTATNAAGPAVRMRIKSDGGIVLSAVKSGATQVAAGAEATEIWKTASHATLPDNVLMIGV